VIPEALVVLGVVGDVLAAAGRARAAQRERGRHPVEPGGGRALADAPVVALHD
jgi:hypothetical protein